MGHIATVRAEMRHGLSLSNSYNVENGMVHESFSSLSLNDFYAAVSVMCEMYHKKCKRCGVLYDACDVLRKKKVVSLKIYGRKRYKKI